MAPVPAKARGRPSLSADLPVVLGALTGGLLSSSCCVVQLVLNSLSLGCAGLSVFKPYRLFLRLITAALLGALLLRNGINRRMLGTVVASLLLTTSEDALTAVNRAGSVRALLQRTGLLRGGGKGSGGGAPTADAPAAMRWHVEVRGMRCQACAARVRGSVAALPGVLNATVALGEGRLEVWADAAASAALTGEDITAAITSLDPEYQVELTGLECYARDSRRVGCGGEVELARLSPSASSGSGSAGEAGQRPGAAASDGGESSSCEAEL